MARILVVEDELVAAWSIQESLESFGHEIVAIATSGAEAIEQAIAIQPCLIVMDIILRGDIDGIAAASHIRGTLGTPVIFLTAHTDDQTLQRAIATEPFGYLVKPFNKTELHTTINVALRRFELEQQLEQAEQWLSTTLYSIGDGTIATDKHGLITFINPAAELLTGWQQSEVLGQPICQVLDLIHAETGEAIENPLNQAIREGVKVTLPEKCVLRTKDGSKKPIGDAATPIRNSDGDILGGVLIFQDISQRKAVEELLHQRAQEFRALVEHSPDIIARVDRELRYLYVNPAFEQIIGIPAHAVLRKTNRELQMPPALLHRWEHSLKAARDTAQEQTVTFDVSTVEGDRVYHARIVPEFAEDGRLRSVLSVARDITEHQRAHEQSQLQAERERLLRDITQRIRQSLELSYILGTTVNEVRRLLQTDRVVVYRFQPDWSGHVIAESVGEGWSAMLGIPLFDPCISREFCIIPYTQGYVGITEDVEQSGLADCYVEVLRQFHIRSNLVIPILEGEQLWGLLAAQQCNAPRRWHDWQIDLLKQLSGQISIAIQQSQLYQQICYQVQREQTLNHLVQTIRNASDITCAFSTVVDEIGRFLQVDQAEIVQYALEHDRWLNVASYARLPKQAPALGLGISDVGNQWTKLLKQGQIVRIDNYVQQVNTANQPIAHSDSGAWLLIPIQIDNQTWGSLSLNRSRHSWIWRESEVNLAAAVADQLAIAIHQSQLYQHVQQLNNDLGEQVQRRTAELEQAFAFEETLKRITDRVRDSLDENQILQTAVQELARVIGVRTCNAALYDLEQQISVIGYEFTQETSIFQGYPLHMANFQPGYRQLLAGQHFQFCSLFPHPEQGCVAKLACPIQDDQGVLGDLWLSHQSDFGFSEPHIRLVQQVANQCAIALRQARLFETAHAQVRELERLNRLKDEFLSTISHELRTPLANIRMATQMLEIAMQQLGIFEAQPSAIARYFQILKEEGQREINLIDDLIAFSRIESETTPLSFSPVDLHAFLLSVLDTFRESLVCHDRQLEVSLPTSLPLIETHSPYLGRIFNELLTNADKYTPARELIRVSAEIESDHVVIRVSNTGVEIPLEERDRIFEKFYRIPNHDPWQFGGTGLGLALVQKLAQPIGATVAVYSAANQTMFTVALPVTHSERS